ncbi:MAG: gamma-glutamyl-gamma-aminobutyrate hydrolase family protein [Alphaproteobacteria bacterium]|nr:gamma-glutamyl-gamma-aminobutyrate hydrolase family protein [Alphaproteobacteria bacterium]
MTKLPIIGITLDNEPSGGYSDYPWYALRENYCDAVTQAGGLPLCLPQEVALAEHYLDLIEGLIVTGGAFDVDPAMFGATQVHAKVTTKDRRTTFEWAMLQGALDRDMPVLGICGGEQLLNVVLGGTLIQHISDEVPNALQHEQKHPKHEPDHDIRIVENTFLHRLAGATTLKVNTTHHQAVGKPGKGVVVSAAASDGVIEAIEVPGKKFCLGVQWHPEYCGSEAEKNIFTAFIEATRA